MYKDIKDISILTECIAYDTTMKACEENYKLALTFNVRYNSESTMSLIGKMLKMLLRAVLSAVGAVLALIGGNIVRKKMLSWVDGLFVSKTSGGGGGGSSFSKAVSDYNNVMKIVTKAVDNDIKTKKVDDPDLMSTVATSIETYLGTVRADHEIIKGKKPVPIEMQAATETLDRSLDSLDDSTKKVLTKAIIEIKAEDFKGKYYRTLTELFGKPKMYKYNHVDLEKYLQSINDGIVANLRSMENLVHELSVFFRDGVGSLDGILGEKPGEGKEGTLLDIIYRKNIYKDRFSYINDDVWINKFKGVKMLSLEAFDKEMEVSKNVIKYMELIDTEKVIRAMNHDDLAVEFKTYLEIVNKFDFKKHQESFTVIHKAFNSLESDIQNNSILIADDADKVQDALQSMIGMTNYYINVVLLHEHHTVLFEGVRKLISVKNHEVLLEMVKEVKDQIKDLDI